MQFRGRIRFDWGPTGAADAAEGVDLAVVVDVLSFTTTLTVAVERGITVLPYPWPKGAFTPTVCALLRHVAACWPAGHAVHLLADRGFPSRVAYCSSSRAKRSA